MYFISQFKVYCAIYCALCFAVVKRHITTITTAFSCHDNSFLINNVPLLNSVAFNVALFDVTLINIALYDTALFYVELF